MPQSRTVTDGVTAEDCAVCGARVPFDDTVHLLVHTHDEDDGVIDAYLCRDCYEEHLAGLLE